MLNYKTKLNHINSSCKINGLTEDAQGFVASLLLQNFVGRDIVFVAKNDSDMEILEQQIRFFAPDLCSRFEVLRFAAWDCMPFDRSSPKQMILGERMRSLCKMTISTPHHNHLPQGERGGGGKNIFLFTTVNALTQKVIPPSIIKHLGLIVKARQKISLAQITEFLIFNGYHRQTTAVDVGEFAVRGGIVDIVVSLAANIIGYRIDFFGDEVESIKEFDVATQLSQDLVREIEILPASEIILNKKTCENFRMQYRQNFAQNLNALGEDQLYTNISQERYYEGMEHWLPFFYQEKLVSVFDYLKNPLTFCNEEIFLLLDEREQIVKDAYKSRFDSIKESKITGNIYNPIAPELLYFFSDKIKDILQKNLLILLDAKVHRHEHQQSSLTIEENWIASPRLAMTDKKVNATTPEIERKIDLEIKSVPNFALAARVQMRDPIEVMLEYIKNNNPQIDRHNLPRKAYNDKKVIIACLSSSSQERIKKLLLDFDANLNTCLLQINQGFEASDFILIGEQAIFGEKIVRRKTNNKVASKRILEEGLAINIGDLIVHRNHGIGKFDGIHTITMNLPHSASASATQELSLLNKREAGAIKTDMLKIIYGGSDVLFVPVEDIDLITRYGDDNPLIQLDRLGVAAWKNRKAKVRNRIKIAAEELIKIAAARHVKQAPIFVPNTHLYEEFKAQFGFIETDDQLKAIEEVEDDLRKGSPMDLLICGDVGFGKTEVAMRAAFVVASSSPAVVASEAKQSIFSVPMDCHATKASRNDGVDNTHLKHQVAIVTPTTLLCRQHFHNFTKRFEGTNIKVAQLSRLITSAQQKKNKEDLENGAIDIVIGTHALLSKNIKFKNLALVIIDEEQHFGVAQKERLKELKNETHLLTLSATPIPRTLQMSLTGVKDLSLIATPPIDRLAVRNFVMQYDPVIAREAIMREYQRGGKTFFVVPRISDIRVIEENLQKSLPQIKITHAHGQMAPNELDQIMNDFYDSKIDVLLSTTIIESGIDIASANTIIIYKAEMFGLAQLYQLRGRVGRSKIRGYAYFMITPKKINKDAKKKLEVMQHLDNLGVGFTIASHDMDIRGSGDLLGDEQSGHIKETGVELYQQMLVEEIEKLKTNSEQITAPAIARDLDWTPQIKLGISLLIPQEYIADLSLRMVLYKKITNITNNEEAQNLTNEMNDRFGLIPQEITNLMQVSIIKHKCVTLRIERIEANKEGILVSFYNNNFAEPEKLLQMIFASKNQIKLQTNQKILFIDNREDKITATLLVIEKLKNLQN